MKKGKTKKNEESKESKEIEINDLDGSGEPEEEAAASDKKILDENDNLLIAEIENKNNKISELENDIKELKETLLRRAAEFENYKRRTESNQQNFVKYAAESFIINLLPVYSDFERSLDHIDDVNDKSFREGIKLLFQKFNKIMEEQGVKKIDAEGKPFDFNLHEALMQQPAKGVEPHTVLQVIEPGFMFKDKVIKHAKVVVSQELMDNGDENENKDSESSE